MLASSKTDFTELLGVELKLTVNRRWHELNTTCVSLVFPARRRFVRAWPGVLARAWAPLCRAGAPQESALNNAWASLETREAPLVRRYFLRNVSPGEVMTEATVEHLTFQPLSAWKTAESSVWGPPWCQPDKTFSLIKPGNIRRLLSGRARRSLGPTLWFPCKLSGDAITGSTWPLHLAIWAIIIYWLTGLTSRTSPPLGIHRGPSGLKQLSLWEKTPLDLIEGV